MIKRQGFVSNSSSSSFIVAYDKKVFGDMEKAFEDDKFGGYGTAIMKVIADVDKFIDETTEDNEEIDIVVEIRHGEKEDEIREAMKKASNEGKTLAYVNTDMGIDEGLLTIWNEINRKHGGNAFKLIYKQEE